jgi:hypothetical protein
MQVELVKNGPESKDPVPRQARFAAGVPVALAPHLCLFVSCHNKQTNRRNTLDVPRTYQEYTKTEKCPSPYAMSNLPRSQPPNSRLSTVPSQKPRQLSHLQAQLAQLTANMADLESLMRMTAGQAQDMRGLGGYAGAM